MRRVFRRLGYAAQEIINQAVGIRFTGGTMSGGPGGLLSGLSPSGLSPLL